MKNDLPSNHLPLTHLGAVPLARLIARGEVSASEALEQHIARAVHIQPRLNAMVAERFDAARAEARAADARRAHGESLGPLHGVPISIKDSLDLQAIRERKTRERREFGNQLTPMPDDFPAELDELLGKAVEQLWLG